jgi:iron complex outermembrane receptor protein
MDGVFIPRPGAILGSFLDVRSVEVLSGPQGTLFGRNAAMGAISINTNAPSHEQTFEGIFDGSSHGTYAATAIANLPVGSTFAVRAAGKVNHTDGYFRNLYDGKRYGETTGYVGRLSAKWEATPELTWTGRIDGSKTDGDDLHTSQVIPDTAPAAALANLSAASVRLGGPALTFSSRPDYMINQAMDLPPFLDDKQWGVTSDLSWEMSPVLTVRLLNSYRDWHNQQRSGDTPGLPVPVLQIQQESKSKANSHELQLISAKDAFLGNRLGFTAGLYYFHEDYSFYTIFKAGPKFCAAFYGTNATLVNACNAGSLSDPGHSIITQKVNSIAAYMQANYKVLDNLQLDLGVRYTHDEKTADLVQTNVNPRFVLVSNESSLGMKFSDSKPSYRASLSWTPVDRVMLFATFSTGYKSGGFSSQAGAALGPAARLFQSETVTDYEVGVKSTLLDGRLRFNGTLFDTHLKNFQDRSYNGIAFVIRNAGSVRSRGADVDGQFVPSSHISIPFAVTYLDSIYTDNKNAPGLEGCTGAVGCPTVQDLTGKPLQYSPHWRGNVGISVRTDPLFDGFSASFSVTESFSSSFLTANTNNPQSRLPGYALTDARMSFENPDYGVRLDLFVQNVFDKRYYTTATPQTLGAQFGATNTTTGTTVYKGNMGEPRRVGLRLSVKM